ncbi:hypothetical protein EYV94_06755 [Puteibacter caeruleilacunae]|nr:hypothetical protein EYV94_06755 [Puteibacter caeruleilacunae]
MIANCIFQKYVIILISLVLMKQQKNIYVITGGPGFGKTSIVESLNDLGYKVCSEYARELIASGLENNNDILPWKNPRLFQQVIFDKRKAFYETVTDEELAFVDRSIIDQIAYSRIHGRKESAEVRDFAKNYRYAETVFFTPPWEEIYTTDAVRKESFHNAEAMHHLFVQTYIDYGYSVVQLPHSDVMTRINFILKYIHND